jgi:hypothetical protein
MTAITAQQGIWLQRYHVDGFQYPQEPLAWGARPRGASNCLQDNAGSQVTADDIAEGYLSICLIIDLNLFHFSCGHDKIPDLRWQSFILPFSFRIWRIA